MAVVIARGDRSIRDVLKGMYKPLKVGVFDIVGYQKGGLSEEKI